MTRHLHTDPFPGVPGKVPTDVVVITPHRAAAAALGVPYRSLPGLAREVIRKKGLAVAPPVHARHTLKRVIGRTTAIKDTSSYVRRIREILETILRTGIDTNDLARYGSTRVRELATITREYREELLKQGFIDRAELIWHAAHATPERRRIFVYGHHTARKEEVWLINAIAADESRFFLPCGDDSAFTVNNMWAEWLAGQGWEPEPANVRAPRTGGQKLAARLTGSLVDESQVYTLEYPNIEAEVRGVLAEAKHLVAGGVDPHRIAILCRDQQAYGPTIASIAAEYRLPVDIKYKIGLTGTDLGGFVRLVLDAVAADLSYETTARMLMHPFGPGMPDGAWTLARGRRTSGLDGWTQVGRSLDKLKWPETQTLSAWSASLKDVFQEFGTREKAALRAREILAFNAFGDALAALDHLEGDRPMSLDEFRAVAAEILADESVPFQPAAGGIALHEPNTIFGADYDHLFIVGLAEGMFPAPLVDNPVVDFFERKALIKHGIDFEEAADVARWETLSFYFSLLAGRDVRLSYPATMDRSELVRSSFFDRLGIKPRRSDEVLRIASCPEELRTTRLRTDEPIDGDAVVDAARKQLKVEARRESQEPFDEYDGVVGVPLDPSRRTWSVSQLNTIGQCGYRWFAQRLLKLAEVDELELGMDYTKRGSFYHRVLELAIAKAMDEPDIREGALNHLEEAFAEAEADPETDLPMVANWELQRTEHLKTIRKAILAEEFIGEGTRVLAVEKDFELEWRGFTMKGQIDRIDDTRKGLIAIDYKTSSSPPKGVKDESGKLAIDVQIPFYSKVALAELYPEGNLGSSVYYSLVKGKVLRTEKPDDYPKLEAFADRIKIQLEKGSYAIDPDADEYACKWCRFDAVCRKGPRLERKVNGSND